MAGLLTAAVVLIELAFLRDDFHFALVADHSSTTTPTFYKLTAMWSSQEGSLLLWAWVLSLASSGVLFLTRRRHREIVPWATAVLAGLGSFFIGLMILKAQPFAHLSPAPVEGNGLTPLLRNPYMAVHPPMLYSGYVLWSIPFAFCVGALITPPARRELDPDDPQLRPARLDLPRHRPAARLALVLRGARLGRLLGLGPGGERGADALAGRHRLPALGDGAGEAGDAEGLERQPDLRDLLPLPARHLPGALGSPAVDPRLRRLDRRRAAAGADRGGGGRLDRADRHPARPAAARAPDRLAALARVDLPGQQPAAGGACRW